MTVYRPPTGLATGPALSGVLLMGLLLGGCGFEPQPSHQIPGGPVADPAHQSQAMEGPVEAPCTVYVDGTGDVDIEDDYIANVVACENGNAPMEALKAQAVQARGYLYYKLLVTGADSIVDSEADQVYSCSYASAESRHFEAAEATRGQYLAWDDHIIASFYVAGAIPSDTDTCDGATGNDPTDTEGFVTYNQGLTGCDITMTPLGWVPDDCTQNPQNRGCASQNGQTCLANQGWSYDDMIAFYYGDDITIAQATGACGEPAESPSNSDLFCQDQDGDGQYCRGDDAIECADEQAQSIESCPYGCDDGACLDAPEDTDRICDDADDGWRCIHNGLSLQCQEGSMTDRQFCTAGCVDGRCVSTGQNPDDQQSPSTEDEETTLVTTSPGIQGGCSQTGLSSSPLPVSLLVLLAMLSISSRRGDRRRRPVPE